MVKLWNPLQGFNNMSSLLQLSVGSAVCACWITCLSSAVTFSILMHPTATLAHTKVTDLTGRVALKVSEQSPYTQDVRCYIWPRDLHVCASETEHFYWACSYMRIAAANVLRLRPWPSQSAISSSQMMCMMAAEAQPKPLLATVASKPEVPRIVHTNHLNWLTNIYATSIKVSDNGSEYLEVQHTNADLPSTTRWAWWRKQPMWFLFKCPQATGEEL